MINGEIYTEYWLMSFYEIASKFLKYKIPTKFDDISRNFGLEGYQFFMEIHNLNENLCDVSQRVLDFIPEKDKAIAWINDLKIRMLKDKFIIDWRSLAFSDKIKDICIIDFILFSEFGNPISWGSYPAFFKFEESNGNEGDGYSLTIINEHLRIAVYLRDKGKFWVLVSINLEMPLATISKFFQSTFRKLP